MLQQIEILYLDLRYLKNISVTQKIFIMNYAKDYFLYVQLPKGTYKYRSTTENINRPNKEFKAYLDACYLVKNNFFITKGIYLGDEKSVVKRKEFNT